MAAGLLGRSISSLVIRHSSTHHRYPLARLPVVGAGAEDFFSALRFTSDSQNIGGAFFQWAHMGRTVDEYGEPSIAK